MLSDPTFLVGVLVGAAIVIAGLGALLVVKPWVQAVFSGAPVGFFHVVGMRLRGTPIAMVVGAYISLRKAARQVPLDLVEATYIAHRGTINSERELVRQVEAAIEKRHAEP